MPFCNICKYEYVEGITKCPDCDVDLVDQLSDEEEIIQKDEFGEPVGEELVSIFTTNDRIEATLVKDMLEASGIAVYEQPGMAFYGKPLDSLADISLSVFKSQAEDAVKLIEQAQEADGE